MRREHILFVDDEPNVLQGLRRMLRGMRDEWEMTFVDGGEAALRHMALQPVDVVISDMRMPEMSGAQLLNEISNRHPETIRIALSGYAEQETVMQIVGPSHQYLAKPCDPERLVSTIKRAVNLRKCLSDAALRHRVAGLKSLPSMPSVYRDFLAAVANPVASTDSIAAPVERDVGLTAEILKLTNSAYFSLPTKVTDLRQALQFLGVETIRGLVALVSVFSAYKGEPRSAQLVNRLGQRSFEIGMLARDLARQEGLSKPEVDQAFCAGMLAHVGTLILITSLHKEYEEVRRIADHEHMAISVIEHRELGATHPQIGAYLLGLWGFSDPIVEAVLYHHSPENADWDAFGPGTAVHVAQALARFSEPTSVVPTSESIEPFVDVAHLTRVGCAGQIEVWCQRMDERRNGRGTS